MPFAELARLAHVEERDLAAGVEPLLERGRGHGAHARGSPSRRRAGGKKGGAAHGRRCVATVISMRRRVPAAGSKVSRSESVSSARP